jgi:molybdopterin synthase sulfur carrier subunit
VIHEPVEVKYMSITVKFFASIRVKLGKSHDTIDYKGVTSVADVWERTTRIPPPAHLLAAVNQEYAGLGQAVHDGDEVAFFPPVTGGQE